MSKKYAVKFYKGDYLDRQKAANKDKAICYCEQHFNSSLNPDARLTLVVVADNASERSCAWGSWYARATAAEFGTVIYSPDGLCVGGFGGRGNGNLKYTSMPAILLEPLFASNPKHADVIRSTDGQERLARVLADSIRTHFPDGGLVAFSVGHKYRKSKVADRGAPLTGGGVEADYAEQVLLKAKALLEQS